MLEVHRDGPFVLERPIGPDPVRPIDPATDPLSATDCNSCRAPLLLTQILARWRREPAREQPAFGDTTAFDNPARASTLRLGPAYPHIRRIFARTSIGVRLSPTPLVGAAVGHEHVSK